MNAPATELAALYHALLVEHGRNPRHARLPAGTAHVAERDNPLCGDQVAIGMRIDGQRIAEVGFEAQGCLISVAAASLLCDAVQGQSLAGARSLCDRYLALVAAREADWPMELGSLAALAPVARFPARASCATLAFTAFADALDRVEG